MPGSEPQCPDPAPGYDGQTGHSAGTDSLGSAPGWDGTRYRGPRDNSLRVRFPEPRGCPNTSGPELLAEMYQENHERNN